MTGEYTLHQGDCLDILPTLAANSVDAIVTDPPYGLGFMGKDWDHGVPGEHFWREALRVAKPGAHLLAFGGTRTFHRLAVAIEDAGWEIRDTVMWVYGSGFPKSLDVSKAIDRKAGAEREVVGVKQGDPLRFKNFKEQDGNKRYTFGNNLTTPATPDAERWAGWGTALKPAWEPIIVARKPLIGTVAENVLAWGTGAINVDGCRVGTEEELGRNCHVNPYGSDRTWSTSKTPGRNNVGLAPSGRWPANLIHDGSEEVLGLFPVTSSGGSAGMRQRKPVNTWGGKPQNYPKETSLPGDTGSAARFFYCAKASKADRDEGCEGEFSFFRQEDELPLHQSRQWNSGGIQAQREQETERAIESQGLDARGRPLIRADGSETLVSRFVPHVRANNHPTVKPTDLMRYLIRLVTPPNGLVLDPFMGSGSTGKAAMREHVRFIGIELDPDYSQIAHRRIDAAARQLRLNFEPLPDWADGVIEEVGA